MRSARYAAVERRARLARPDAWYLTWGIVYEFLRVTTHRRDMRRPWSLRGAWGFIAVVLPSPGLGLLVPGTRHAEVAAAVFGEFPELAGNLVHDLGTVVLMREHGISRSCTRDSDFHRVGFLDVIDPLRA